MERKTCLVLGGDRVCNLYGASLGGSLLKSTFNLSKEKITGRCGGKGSGSGGSDNGWSDSGESDSGESGSGKSGSGESGSGGRGSGGRGSGDGGVASVVGTPRLPPGRMTLPNAPTILTYTPNHRRVVIEVMTAAAVMVFVAVGADGGRRRRQEREVLTKAAVVVTWHQYFHPLAAL